MRSTNNFLSGPSPETTRSAWTTKTPGAKRGGGNRPLTILFITVFLDLLGFGIVIPLLPLYAEEFGASPVAVTWLVAVYSLMQFAVAPWWGQLSDRWGRRPILLIGLFGSGLSYLLFGIAGSLAMLFVARILAGVMGANIGVAQAYVADVTAPSERARGMGMIGAAFGLGFIFGPAVGGALSHFGMAVPFLVAGVLAMANGLLAISWLPESLPIEARGEKVQAGIGARFRLFRGLTRAQGMAALYAGFFLITLAFAALEATLSLWADRRWELTPARVAYLFAYLGLVVTIVQGVLVGPLTRRLGERRLALFGTGAFAVGLLALPLAPNLFVLALALAILGTGQGTAIPAISALISQRAPEGSQGRLLSISQSLSALGRVIGPVAGGILFSRVGIGAPYFAGALMVAVAVSVLGVFVPARGPTHGEGGP